MPVDLSSAVELDKRPEGLRYFGHDPGDFLTVHVDYDLEADSVLFGVEKLRLVQSVHYYYKGEGKTAGVEIRRNWLVETVE